MSFVPTGKPSGQTHATVGWASRNWSGYAVTGGAPYTDVTGQWTVPSVSACSSKSSGCYSATWTGIDGFTNSPLIQTGTEQDYSRGGATYQAWWTTSALGYSEQVISAGCSSELDNNCGTVAAGDSMSAHITKTSGSLWTITLSDSSARWTLTTTTSYTGPGASAEWIMEAPSIGHIATLPNYANLTFDKSTADGVSPGLVASNGGELIRKRQVVSIPSGPDLEPGGKPSDGFAMAYGSTAPNPPPS
jgi:hypothetical protein